MIRVRFTYTDRDITKIKCEYSQTEKEDTYSYELCKYKGGCILQICGGHDPTTCGLESVLKKLQKEQDKCHT